MELTRLFELIKRWYWLILLSVTIAAAASFVASQQATPLYRTKTTMMVGRVTQQLDPSSLDFQTGQRLALTYSQLAVREPVLQGVIDQLGLKIQWHALARRVSAAVVDQTQLFEIYVVDTDPQRAKIIADVIAEQLILHSPTNPDDITLAQKEFTQAQLEDLQQKIVDSDAELTALRQQLEAANSARVINELGTKIDILENKVSGWQNTYSQLLISMQGSDVNALNVVEEAAEPARPFSPNTSTNVLFASLIGFVLSLSGALLIEYTDDTLKTEEDLKRISKVPVVGKIPTIRSRDDSNSLTAYTTPLLPEVEAFRVLRTNLLLTTPRHGLKSIMVTSTRAGEGKTTVISNLAVVLAQYGQRVILVDGDIKSPFIHKLFHLENSMGLTTVLTNPELPLSHSLQTTAIPNLTVLTSGPIPHNTADLLGSKKMVDVINELEEQADYILFDAPPLIISDTLILSSHLDGVLLVSKAQKTHLRDMVKAMEQLHIIRASHIGTIINHAKADQPAYYYGSLHQKNGNKKHRWTRKTDLQSNLDELAVGQQDKSEN